MSEKGKDTRTISRVNARDGRREKRRLIHRHTPTHTIHIYIYTYTLSTALCSFPTSLSFFNVARRARYRAHAQVAGIVHTGGHKRTNVYPRIQTGRHIRGSTRARASRIQPSLKSLIPWGDPGPARTRRNHTPARESERGGGIHDPDLAGSR